MKIYVIGKQWMWKVEHPGGQREIDALHFPIGRPIELIMTSEDVIHDFSVPAFRIKHDVLPGRYETLWFQANRAGTYHLFCTQLCGTGHSDMVGEIVVMSDPDYQKWLEQNGASETLAQARTRPCSCATAAAAAMAAMASAAINQAARYVRRHSLAYTAAP